MIKFIRASTNSNGSTNCSTNCTLGVETVLFFRVNEFSNVVFSKFIAQQKMNKIAKDHIRKFVDPEKLFSL